MENVINFPIKPVRDWAEIERTIRSILQSTPAPIEMIDAVCARMKAAFDQMQCSVSVSVNLPVLASVTSSEREVLVEAVNAAFRDFERQIHDYSSRMFLERLALEIELYQLRTSA